MAVPCHRTIGIAGKPASPITPRSEIGANTYGVVYPCVGTYLGVYYCMPINQFICVTATQQQRQCSETSTTPYTLMMHVNANKVARRGIGRRPCAR